MAIWGCNVEFRAGMKTSKGNYGDALAEKTAGIVGDAYIGAFIIYVSKI